MLATRSIFIFLLLGAVSFMSNAESVKSFIPDDFVVPTEYETQLFRLRVLSVNDLVKDYDAVMSSKEHLQKLFGTQWPEGLTLEQNLIELGWHQREFQMRRTFAFTVVALDESKVLGCVYIVPTDKTGYDAEVTLWARQSEINSGLQKALHTEVKQWLKAKWPFKNPGFPYLDITIEDWTKIPEAKP